MYEGENSRRKESWKSIMTKMRKILSLWRERYVSMDRRIVMLNVVLSNFPLCSFSFYKTPKVIIKDVIKVQKISCGKS